MRRSGAAWCLGMVFGLAAAAPGLLRAEERIVASVEGGAQAVGRGQPPEVSSTAGAGPLHVLPAAGGFVDFICYAEHYNRDLDREYHWRVQVKGAAWDNVMVVTWDYLDEALSVPAGVEGKSVIARRLPFPLPPGDYAIRAMLVDPTKPSKEPFLTCASQRFRVE